MSNKKTNLITLTSTAFFLGILSQPSLAERVRGGTKEFRGGQEKSFQERQQENDKNFKEGLTTEEGRNAAIKARKALEGGVEAPAERVFKTESPTSVVRESEESPVVSAPTKSGTRSGGFGALRNSGKEEASTEAATHESTPSVSSPRGSKKFEGVASSELGREVEKQSDNFREMSDLLNEKGPAIKEKMALEAKEEKGYKSVETRPEMKLDQFKKSDAESQEIIDAVKQQIADLELKNPAEVEQMIRMIKAELTLRGETEAAGKLTEVLKSFLTSSKDVMSKLPEGELKANFVRNMLALFHRNPTALEAQVKKMQEYLKLEGKQGEDTLKGLAIMAQSFGAPFYTGLAMGMNVHEAHNYALKGMKQLLVGKLTAKEYEELMNICMRGAAGGHQLFRNG